MLSRLRDSFCAIWFFAFPAACQSGGVGSDKAADAPATAPPLASSNGKPADLFRVTPTSSAGSQSATPNPSGNAREKPGASSASGTDKPYQGPVGTVSGIVHVSGDESPRFPEQLKKIPEKDCPEAREMYGSLFREGAGRTLADVLVSVTEYDGYVPAKSEAVKVPAKGCAFGSRTLAMMVGQHLEVQSVDNRSYMPKIAGRGGPAAMVALPGGSPAKLVVTDPGLQVLVDQAHPFSLATLFVLNYSTFAVTMLDGAFEIPGIPVGRVKVTAFMPVISQTVMTEVTVEANRPTRVELTIPFSRASFDELMAQPVAAPSAQPTTGTATPTANPKP